MSEIGVCARPGCQNELKTGSTYCSRKCAAADRARVKSLRQKLSRDAMKLIPGDITTTMVDALGNGAYRVLEEWATTLAESKELAPPLLSYTSESGDYSNRYGSIQTDHALYRATDQLGYDTIDDMMRNGQVAFGVEMKRSWLLSVFRNSRSWDIECQDEDTKNIVRAMMKRVLTRHAGEFMEAIPYGSYFGEKIWDFKEASYWGIDGVQDDEKYYGLKSIEAIHPRSINRIVFDDSGHHFDGFVQNQAFGEQKIPVAQSLILTYNKHFRNLWGTPALDPVYPFWFWYEVCMRSFVRYMERMGTPVTVCRAPSRGQIRVPDGALMKSMKYAFLVAGNVAESNAVALPSDVDPDTGQKLWELEYLADDKRGTQFKDALELLGTLIIRSLVISDRAITQGPTGSYAAAAKHFAVTMLHNEHVLTQFINQLNSYVIPQIVEYNIGANAKPATLVTEGLDPEEKERLFKLLSTMGNQAGQTTMNWIDWKKIFAVENIPVLNQEDYDALKEEKQAAADEAMERQRKTGGQFPENGEEEEPEEKDESISEKVEQSADWALMHIASGARFPVVLTAEGANAIFDRLGKRKFQLANPYHDPFGRFTSKAGSSVASGAQAIADNTFRDPNWVAAAAVVHSGKAREIMRSPEEKARIEKETKLALDAVPEELRRKDLRVRHHAGIGTYVSEAASIESMGNTNPMVAMSAGYVKRTGDRTIHLSPSVVRELSSDNEVQRAFARHAIIHESLHARKREFGAEQILKRIPIVSGVYGNLSTPIEEGLTDLMASQISGVAGAGPYSKYRDRMAKIAMSVSGNNKERANQWIKDSHKRATGPMDLTRQLNMAGYKTNLVETIKYLSGGKGSLVDQIGTAKGYGNTFTRPTRKYKGQWETDTNLKRLATGAAEALSASYYRKGIATGIGEALKEAMKTWREMEGVDLEYEEFAPEEWDWDLSVIASAAGSEMSDIIADVPDEYKDAIVTYFGLGYDFVPRMLGDFPKQQEKLLEAHYLFNPYHDKDGEFTSKKDATVVTRTTTKQTAKKTSKKNGKEGFFQKAYSAMSAGAQKALLAPAEYMSRKSGLGPRLAKMGVEIGSDMLIEKLVGAAVLAKASVAGAALTQIAATAIMGAAMPAALPAVGGVLLGIGASWAITTGIDYLQTRSLNAYVNRYSPKDDQHVTLTMPKMGKFKKARMLFSFAPKAIVGTGNIMDMINGGELASGMGMEEWDAVVLESDDKPPSETQKFVASIWPLVSLVLSDEKTDGMRLPYLETLDGFPGFEKSGEYLVMNKAGAEKFAEHYSEADFPEIEKVSFGNPDGMWKTLEEEGALTPKGSEKKLEAYQLFNPFHDKKGQFASKGSKAISKVGTRLSNMPDNLDIVSHDSNKSVEKALGDFSKNGLAAYDNGKIHVTPRGVEVFAKNTKLRDHVYTHEAVHGRLRANGKPMVARNVKQAQFEEGATDLMAAAINGSPNLIAYKGYAASIATMARESSKNQDGAWRFVSESHYKNSDPGFAPSLKPGKWEDVEWLMSSAPQKLEDVSTEGLDEWKKSEEAKWRHIYNITEGGPDSEESNRGNGDGARKAGNGHRANDVVGKSSGDKES